MINPLLSKWDNKITTLPGLYLLSTSVLRLIGLVLNREPMDVCSVFNLRLSNVILSTFTYMIIFKIFAHLNAKRIENHNVNNNKMNLTKQSQIKQTCIFISSMLDC